NELFAPNYVNHSAPANQNDRAAREQGIRSYRAAALDLRVTIDDMIAEGDKVALRWTTHGFDACESRPAVRSPEGRKQFGARPRGILDYGRRQVENVSDCIAREFGNPKMPVQSAHNSERS